MNQEPIADYGAQLAKKNKIKLSKVLPIAIPTIAGVTFLALFIVFVIQKIALDGEVADLAKKNAELTSKSKETTKVQITKKEITEIRDLGCGTGDEKDKTCEIKEDGTVTLTQTDSAGGDVELYAPLAINAKATYPKGWKATRQVILYGNGTPLEDFMGCGGNIPIYTTIDFASPSGNVLARARATNTAPGCMGGGYDQIVRYVKYYDMPKLPGYKYVEIIAETTECVSYDNGSEACFAKSNTGKYDLYTGMVDVASDRYFTLSKTVKVGDTYDETMLNLIFTGYGLPQSQRFYVIFPKNIPSSVEKYSSIAEFSSVDKAQKMLSDSEYITARDMIIGTTKY